MDTLVILNPAAGRGMDVARLTDRVGRRLSAEVAVSDGPGAVARLASEAARGGVRRIVAAGGDGTASELVSGTLGLERDVSLGLLPVGTGNDLARSLGIPLRLEQAVEVVASGRPRPVDVVRASGLGAGGPPGLRHVANAAVGGFCGRIAERIDSAHRRRWRRLAYPRAALSELAGLRAHRIRIELDDGEVLEEESFMVIVANGRYAGGRIPLAPQARPDDGLLDVVVIRAVSALAFAGLVPRVFLGRHHGSPHVLMRRARGVSLTAEPPMWLNADGETWHDRPTLFQVLPAAVRFLTP